MWSLLARWTGWPARTCAYYWMVLVILMFRLWFPTLHSMMKVKSLQKCKLLCLPAQLQCTIYVHSIYPPISWPWCNNFESMTLLKSLNGRIAIFKKVKFIIGSLNQFRNTSCHQFRNSERTILCIWRQFCLKWSYFRIAI